MAAETRTEDGGQAAALLRVMSAACAMGTLGPVAALAYGEGLQPAGFSALRACIGAGILGALVLSRRQPSVHLAHLEHRQQALLALAVTVNGLMNLLLMLDVYDISEGRKE